MKKILGPSKYDWQVGDYGRYHDGPKWEVTDIQDDPNGDGKHVQLFVTYVEGDMENEETDYYVGGPDNMWFTQYPNDHNILRKVNRLVRDA